jgi:hypothetical protein
MSFLEYSRDLAMYFFFLMILEFDLRASYLLGRHSIT